MTNVILLTAVTRLKNLPIMAESVRRVFGATKSEQAKNGFGIAWIVVRDRYNCKGSIEEVKSKLDGCGVDFSVAESGKEGKKNYGGDLFNEPLSELFLSKLNNGEDPWIYIFDDDNILHPLMPYMLKEAERLYPERKALWMNYLGSNSTTYVIFKELAFALTNGTNGKYYSNNPDPSSILVRLSVYKEFYPMNGDGDYDYTYIRPVMMNLYSKGLLSLQHDIEWGSRISANHNGISDRRLINEAIRNAKDLIVTVKLQDGRWSGTNFGSVGLYLPPEANKEIMEIVKKYCYSIEKEEDA